MTSFLRYRKRHRQPRVFLILAIAIFISFSLLRFRKSFLHHYSQLYSNPKCWTRRAGAALYAGRVLKCPPQPLGEHLRLDDARDLSFEFRTGTMNASFANNTPLVNEPFRILFCWIPKVSCSKFKMLFSRLALHRNWTQLSHVHSINSGMINLRAFSRYPLNYANSIVQNPDWLRVAVLRDPVDRFISGYLNKVVQEKCNVFYRNCTLQPTASDVEIFLTRWAWQSNDHFALQQEFCGFKKYRGVWNRIGMYSHDGDMHRITSELFDGLLDVPISHGWGPKLELGKGPVGMWDRVINSASGSIRDNFICNICKSDKVLKLLVDSLTPDYEFFRLPLPNFCSQCRFSSLH